MMAILKSYWYWLLKKYEKPPSSIITKLNEIRKENDISHFDMAEAINFQNLVLLGVLIITSKNYVKIILEFPKIEF